MTQFDIRTKPVSNYTHFECRDCPTSGAATGALSHCSETGHTVLERHVVEVLIIGEPHTAIEAHAEPIVDPDCKAGKHRSCVGGICQCPEIGHPNRHEYERVGAGFGVQNLHYHQHEGEFGDCTRSECVAGRQSSASVAGTQASNERGARVSAGNTRNGKEN